MLTSIPTLARKLGAAFTALWAPVPTTRLRWFEILFTAQFTVWMGMLYLHPFDWLGDEGFHPNLTQLHGGYWKSWPKLPWWGVWMFGGVLLTAVSLIFSGKCKRLGFFLALICSIYVQYADAMSAFTLSRLHIIIYFILWTAPPAVRDASGVWMQSASAVNACRVVIVSLYFVAGWAKVAHGDWLQHDDVLWSHTLGMYRTEPAAWLVRHMPMNYWLVQKWLALGFELGAPLLFGIPRLRTLAVVLGIGFHVTIAICFWSIWAFSLHCIAYYVLFVPERCWRSSG